MIQNKTANFLGAEDAWDRVQIDLHDVQALTGGAHLVLPAAPADEAVVTCCAPDGQETRYKLRLAGDEKRTLCALCVAHDFVAIESDQRMGIADEARPEITLTNAQRESHTVALWAGAVAHNDRFAAVYQALLALSERTAASRPAARRLESSEKWIVLGLLGAALALPGVAAYFPARALAAAWWSARFGLLFGALAALTLSLAAAPALMTRRERHQPLWSRPVSNPVMIGAEVVYVFIAAVGATGMVEEALAIWRGAALAAADTAPVWYGALAYAGALGGWATLLAASLMGERLLVWLHERW